MSINWASIDRGARILDCSTQIAGNEAKHVLEPDAESMWRTDNRDKQVPNKTHWICLSLINIPRNTVIRTVGWHCASSYSSNPQSVFLHVSSDGLEFKAWDRFINPRQTKGTTLFCCSAPIDTEIYPYLVLEVTKTFGDVQKQEGCDKENNGTLLETYMEQIYEEKSTMINKSQGTYTYMNRIYLYSEEVPSSPLASLHRHPHSSPSSSSFSPSRRRPLPASPLPESYSPMPVSLSNHSSFFFPVGTMTRGDATGRSVQTEVEWSSFTRQVENSESEGENGGLNGSENRDSSRRADDSVGDKVEGGVEGVRGNESDDSSGNVSALHSALGLSEEEAEEEEKERREGDDDRDDGYCDEDSLDHLSATASTVTLKVFMEKEHNRAVSTLEEVNTPRRESEGVPPLPPATAVSTAIPPLVVITTNQQTTDHHATSSSSSGGGGIGNSSSTATIPPMTLPPLLLARLAYLEDQLASSSSMVASKNENCMARLACLQEQMRGLRGKEEDVEGRVKGEKDEEREGNVVSTTIAVSPTVEVGASPSLAASTALLVEVPTTTTTADPSADTSADPSAVSIATKSNAATESQPLTEATSEVSSEVMLLTALLHRKLSMRILKQAQLALLQQHH